MLFNKSFSHISITILVTMCILLLTIETVNAQSANFMGKSRGMAAFGQNALGFGYYNSPIVYEYKDQSKEKYLSSYNGWFVKYIRYFGATSALQAHYLQAHGEEDIRELSGSVLYGLNIGGPGIGGYVGISYTLKQRTQFAGVARISDEKAYGWDFPIGVKMKNGSMTLSLETRYEYFILEGDNVSADAVRYPLFFSILMDF